jgi:predicted dienelactone hydrolase
MWLWLAAGAACAALGQAEIAATGQDGPVTVFYPTQAAEERVSRGPFVLSLAPDGPPLRGNGRLVVISHGSGAWPWLHTDLARRLVEAGYTVALPEHRANNDHDDSQPGPPSWARRPGEMSRAIDALARDPRFAPLLRLDKVGVYGMSAGGHTALTMAGGRWSAANYRRHCEANLVADFNFCSGLNLQLTGGWLDGLKQWLVLTGQRLRLSDETVQGHEDPRVAAVVAGVPVAADFEFDSLQQPRVPLGLVLSGQDRWLLPRFHGEHVLQACKTCELIAELPTAGHGALLSPPPPGRSGLLGEMVNDPPGFDRSLMPEVDRQITAFFSRQLLQ